MPRRRTTSAYPERLRLAGQLARTNIRNALAAASSPSQPWWSFHAAEAESMSQRQRDPLQCQWLEACPFCSAVMLDWETPSICCHRGDRMLQPLPPLTPFLDAISTSRRIGEVSLRLNALFNFASHGYTGSRIDLGAGSAFFAIQGSIYRRIFPIARNEAPLNMYIYSPQSIDDAELESVPLVGRVASQYVLGTGADNRDMHLQHWTRNIRRELELFNCLLRVFHQVRDVEPNQEPVDNLQVVLRVEGTAREVAGVLRYGQGTRSDSRSIIVHHGAEATPTRIHYDDPLYEALSFPLFFPRGEPGWPVGGWTQRQYYRFRLLTEARFAQFSRLGNLYMVDMACRMEDERLQFIAKSLATAMHIERPYQVTEDNTDDFGELETQAAQFNTALPSSFVGSQAHRAENVADTLALARKYGPPQGMITLTTNPKWPEIVSALQPGQSPTSVPQVATRVFRARLHKLLRMIRSEWADMAYIVSVIEFQKRGMPHAHIVFCAKTQCPIEELDKMVSAEVPGPEHPRLRELVMKFMQHSKNHLIKPNGEPNIHSRCYREGQCIYKFPLPLNPVTHVDPVDGKVVYRRRREEDQWTAPYSPFLLLAWEGHAHMEICYSLEAFVYLFKYIHKGPDYVDYRLRNEQEPPESFEEGAQAAADAFIRGRYLSATEAFWRIAGFELSQKNPSVARLGVHAPGENRAQFNRSKRPLSDASTLIRYFLRPNEFLHLKYTDYYEQTVARGADSKYIRNENPEPLPPGRFLERTEPGQKFKPQLISARQRGIKVARLKAVRPGAGEVYYLRQLLIHRSATSFNDLRTTGQGTPGRILHSTFQGAAVFLGLFENNNEAALALQDACELRQSPGSLRHLYCLLIIDGAPAQALWDQFADALSSDFMPRGTQPPSTGERIMAHEAARVAIASVLHSMDQAPRSFGLYIDAERPPEVAAEIEAFRPRRRFFRDRADQARERFNPEQKNLYDLAMSTIEDADTPKLLLIQGRAGRGKTYVVHAIVNRLRSLGTIVAVSGATGLCASAFERGSTVHRMFDIPVLDQDADEGIPLISRIQPGSRRAEYLREAAVVVMDEIWALNRAVVEAVDNVMRLIMDVDEPFGGKAVIAVGDPRQTAPIVKRGGRPDVVAQSMCSSSLLTLFRKIELQAPVRNAQDLPFSIWVDAVGDDSTCQDVNLKDMFAVTTSMEQARSFLFPPEVLRNAAECSTRAFLTPYNADVDEFNALVLDSIPAESRSVRSYDTIKGDIEPGRESLAAPEVLNKINHGGVPPHEIALKEGALCVVMRNISPAEGLVKNAKVAVLRIQPRVIQIKILSSNKTFWLPRITFEFQALRFPFRIIRKQFPLRLAYALTFHGCQGATLYRTVLDCRKPVFAHGQRYACVSRGRTRAEALALISEPTEGNENPNSVNNVVYEEFVRA